MKYPRVLAVIPAYNSAEFIEKTVISLVKQDYPYLRRIVIDDCSKDGTGEIVSKYAGRLEVLRNETNSGLAFGLNRALTLAKDEEFLLILEDDVEIVDTDYVTRSLKHFEDSRVGIVCGQPVDFGPDRLSLVDLRLCSVPELMITERTV